MREQNKIQENFPVLSIWNLSLILFMHLGSHQNILSKLITAPSRALFLWKIPKLEVHTSVFTILFHIYIPYFSAYNTPFLPRNLRREVGAFNATEHKIVQFFPQHCSCLTGAKSCDKSDWSSETRTQFGNKNKLLFMDISQLHLPCLLP